MTFTISTEQSTIKWTGRKVTGAHNGTIGLKSGKLKLSDGKLTGGDFTVDTTSIKILDVTDPDTNAQFAAHLASEDFFAAEKYPEARFVISSVSPAGGDKYDVNGFLTIKDLTHPVVFEATLHTAGESLMASGLIIVDRTLYGMKFRSGNFFKDLGDTLIYNDFELQVSITAREATGY
jgi:polyisoprenoid-binding protein YceI